MSQETAQAAARLVLQFARHCFGEAGRLWLRVRRALLRGYTLRPGLVRWHARRLAADISRERWGDPRWPHARPVLVPLASILAGENSHPHERDLHAHDPRACETYPPRLVARLLRRLPRCERRAFRAVHLQGGTAAELALRWGTTSAAINANCYLARRRLRSAVREEFPEIAEQHAA